MRDDLQQMTNQSQLIIPPDTSSSESSDLAMTIPNTNHNCNFIGDIPGVADIEPKIECKQSDILSKCMTISRASCVNSCMYSILQLTKLCT